MQYEPGTRVWSKTCSNIWWPGKIVELKDTPESFQNFVAKKKKKYIAIVYYETEETYDAVINVNKLMLYDCTHKMEFLKKGYQLYEKQRKGGIIKNGIDMDNFLEDVKLAEKDVNGDENIFEQFIETKPVIDQNKIHSLFVTPKKKSKIFVTPNKTHMGVIETKIQPNNDSREASVKITGAPTQALFCCRGKCGINACSFQSNSENDLNVHLKSNQHIENKVNTMKIFLKVEQSELEAEAGGSNSNKRKLPCETSDAEKIKNQEFLSHIGDEDSDEEHVASTSTKMIVDNNSSFENVPTVRHLQNPNSLLDYFVYAYYEESNENAKKSSKWKNPVAKQPIVIHKELSKDCDKIQESDAQASLSKYFVSKNTERSAANIKNKITAGDGVKVGSCYLKFFNPEIYLSSPHWMTKNMWTTWEYTQFERVKEVMAANGTILDLSKMKLIGTLEPMISKLSLKSLINDELSLEIAPEDKPVPGYQRRTLLIPKNTSAVTYSDEELLNLPLAQNVLKKIELGVIDDLFVSIPGAVLHHED